MHIFSDKKSALLKLTGCIVLLGVTLTVFNLLSNTATASHNNYEGTVMLDTQNQTGNPNTSDDTGKTVTVRGQVQFRLMNVDESFDGSAKVFDQAKLEVESPDDPDSDYGLGYFSNEGDERTIDGEDIELISVECNGDGCTGSGDFYWELEFGVVVNGNQCTFDYPDEGQKVECGRNDAGNCVVTDDGQEGWLNGVPSCGDSGEYLTDPGECTGIKNQYCGRGESAETETRTQTCTGDCDDDGGGDDDDGDDGDDGGGGGGGACDGNTATTTSVSDYFSELSVESSLDCPGDVQPGDCNSTSSSSKSASLDLSNVLDDGQTPGEITVSFRSNEPSWSEGFTAAVDCESDGYCDAKAEITYPKDPAPSPQRSVNTQYKTDTVHNADDWIIEDIRDGQDEVTLETVASSSIGGSGEYKEGAIADITIDDIQLQVCEADDDNNPPTADDDGTNDNPICVDSSDPTDINVLDNDSDPDGDDLKVTKVAGNSVTDEDVVPVGNGTVTVKDADAGTLRYTPSNTSPESFTYTAADGNGGKSQATVYVDPGSCGPLTVRVEDPDGNLVPGVGFKPKYDEDNNGQPEQLPEKGLETGKFTYNVTVDDDPSLSKMNQGLLTQIPSGFASSVENYDKELEVTDGQEEPDGYRYPPENINLKKSKLATDPDGDDNGGGDNSPNAVLSCSGSQDQTFGQDCVSQYGQDAFAAVFDASGSTDPDNDIDTYDWTSQSGNIGQTTNHPDADIQYCVNTASNDTQDTVVVEVTDDEGNSDSASKQIGDMCPFGGGGCSEVSVQDDFSGDDLSGSDYIERGETNQDTVVYSFTPDPKTATLDVSSILSSGESAGDMIVEFSSTSNGFSADVNCSQGEDPSQCGASAQIAKDQTQLRSVSVTGDPDPNASAENNADLSFNVDDNETVELNTSASAGISQNTNSDAEGSILITDITLEVCD